MSLISFRAEKNSSHPGNPVGDVGLQEGLLNRSGKAVGPHKDSDVVVFTALPEDEGADPLADKLPLLGIISWIENFNGFSRGHSGPESLFLSIGVVGDQKIRGAKDVLGGAVVLLQLYLLPLGKILFKAQDVPVVRPAPRVDGLIIVPYHTDISMP